TFLKPVTYQQKVSSSDLAGFPVSQVGLYRYNFITAHWEILPTQPSVILSSGSQVSATVFTHASMLTIPPQGGYLALFASTATLRVPVLDAVPTPTRKANVFVSGLADPNQTIAIALSTAASASPQPALYLRANDKGAFSGNLMLPAPGLYTFTATA